MRKGKREGAADAAAEALPPRSEAAGTDAAGTDGSGTDATGTDGSGTAGAGATETAEAEGTVTRVPVAGVTVPVGSTAGAVEIPRQQSVATAADAVPLPDPDGGTGEAAHR
ncbi:hypothetical protein AB0E83_11895 [Streptomyces sp. NPDC035033]|uniref:hypothetical protein n=1 Tax=Streptomyces sp. NPDC035033 TaxID=3155368 RepID=UPI0033FC88EF